MNYRKKPVVISAVQFLKFGDHPAVKAAMFEHNGTFLGTFKWTANYSNGRAFRYGWWIPTLEGGHEVTVGDWIITGTKGETYPLSPEELAAECELVDGGKGGGND